MVFRILSIDGGGSRGIIPARILQRLESTLQGSITDRVDLLAGTSTGGIICLGLAAGVETEDLVRLYQVHSKSIFRESFADRLSGGLDEHLRANYKAEPLNRLLENIFGDRRLGDLHDSPQFGGRGKEVMVCAFDLHPDCAVDGNLNYRPIVFHSAFMQHQNEKLVDIGMRTSAGPTYFPIYERKYIDGGVAMNNPSMAAIAYAVNDQKTSAEERHAYLRNGYKGLRKQLKDIHLLSLGTGTSNKNRIAPAQIGRGNWGNIQWIKYLPDLLTESNIQAANYYAMNVLPHGQYVRINPSYDNPEISSEELWGRKIGMDTGNSKILHALEQLADKVFEQHEPELKRFLGLVDGRREN